MNVLKRRLLRAKRVLRIRMGLIDKEDVLLRYILCGRRKRGGTSRGGEDVEVKRWGATSVL